MPPEPDDTLREIFGEPVDVYTDEQALDDGVLVDVAPMGLHFHGRPVNRITGGLWGDFASCVTPTTPLEDILRAKLRYGILKGGIWQVPPGLWLIENEVGGWTLMRPEDY